MTAVLWLLLRGRVKEIFSKTGHPHLVPHSGAACHSPFPSGATPGELLVTHSRHALCRRAAQPKAVFCMGRRAGERRGGGRSAKGVGVGVG